VGGINAVRVSPVFMVIAAVAAGGAEAAERVGWRVRVGVAEASGAGDGIARRAGVALGGHGEAVRVGEATGAAVASTGRGG
jgi:hypothetical protein